MQETIYIDGVLHHYEPHNNGSHNFSEIFVDSPSMPHRRCARHRIAHLTLQQLKHGYVVRTGGHLYSTYPLDPDTLTPLYPHARTKTCKPNRLTNYWAKVKELVSAAVRRITGK